jgi:hypothetical protein
MVACNHSFRVCSLDSASLVSSHVLASNEVHNIRRTPPLRQVDFGLTSARAVPLSAYTYLHPESGAFGLNVLYPVRDLRLPSCLMTHSLLTRIAGKQDISEQPNIQCSPHAIEVSGGSSVTVYYLYLYCSLIS